MTSSDARYEGRDTMTEEDSATGRDVRADHDQTVNTDATTPDDSFETTDRGGPFGTTTKSPTEGSTRTDDFLPVGTSETVVETEVPVEDDAVVENPAAAAATPSSPALSGPEAGSSAGAADWRELQGRFVDDPPAAVKEAADRVEQALTRLRTRLEQGSTEDLRMAFRQLRELHSTLH